MGGVWAFASFEARETAGAWNTLAILADKLGHSIAGLVKLEGQKAERGSSAMSYRHSENPTPTRPGGEA